MRALPTPAAGRLFDSLVETLHENTKLDRASLTRPPRSLTSPGGRSPRAVPGEKPPFVPLPSVSGPLSVSLGDAISRRRSVRRYREEAMSLITLSRFLALGAAPELLTGSGALVEVHVVLWDVEGIDPGMYRYDATRGGLLRLSSGPSRTETLESLFQSEFATGTGVLLLVGDVAGAVDAFGLRGYRLLLEQAGVLGETFYLVGTALGVGVSGNGGFRETTVQRHARLDGIRRDVIWTLPFGLAPHAEGRP